MSPTSNDSNSTKPSWLPIGLALLLVAGLFAVFSDGLLYMVAAWDREEYNHGYLIPVVAFYLLWLRAERIGALAVKPSWTGVAFVALGLAAFVLGELSGIFQIIEYGCLLALFGIIIGALGWRGFQIVWVPFVYLLFMIPLPQFLYQGLSGELQLISSQLGVAVIRLAGVSVFLEGNVIDLGTYQLQVAEACNGLRYLFPLMSFGFLCAAIYLGPWWHRAIIFLSAIPLTIFMNSFRIGMIGILVQYYGISQAEGFLHDFEGWAIFMACVVILMAEMWVLAKLSGRDLMEVFGLDIPATDTLWNLLPTRVQPQSIAAAVLLALGLFVSINLQSRVDIIPERAAFNTFPLAIGNWRGEDGLIEESVAEALASDDYLLATFQNDEDYEYGQVGLWVAYYADQRKGASVHSPRACLPGGGWQLETFEEYTLENIGPDGEGLTVNRSVIANGEARQLVYYWFSERGRIQTNEYWVKWYIFWDSLAHNRTDGALVRLTTFVADPSEIDEADAMLEQFIRELQPRLAYFLPQSPITAEQVATAR